MNALRLRPGLAASLGVLLALGVVATPAAEAPPASEAAAWRALDPGHILYVDTPRGRFVVELAPRMAPQAVRNVLLLARAGFYDGLAVTRVQDNYVAQFGDAESARPRGGARRPLPGEYDQPAAALPFDALPDRDSYAPETGFIDGFPAARDVAGGRAWLVHCYGMLGVGRDESPDSGDGSELFVVIGHAPRHLDRNITLVGRVIAGMPVLSALPRGPDPAGFYADPSLRTPLTRVRVAADVPAAERIAIEALRTDSEEFRRRLDARRFRRESWFREPGGHADVCNVPLPVRARRP